MRAQKIPSSLYRYHPLNVTLFQLSSSVSCPGQVCSAGFDGTVKLWRIKAQSPLHEILLYGWAMISMETLWLYDLLLKIFGNLCEIPWDLDVPGSHRVDQWDAAEHEGPVELVMESSFVKPRNDFGLRGQKLLYPTQVSSNHKTWCNIMWFMPWYQAICKHEASRTI